MELKTRSNRRRVGKATVVLMYIPDEDVYEIGTVAGHAGPRDVVTALCIAADQYQRTAVLVFREVLMVAEPGADTKDVLETWLGARALTRSKLVPL